MWQKGAVDAVARKEKMGKTKEEVFGRGEGGHAMGLGISDLNGEVDILQGAKLHCGIQFGTANG